MFVFWKIGHALFSYFLRFEIRSFTLLPMAISVVRCFISNEVYIEQYRRLLSR